MFTALNKVTLKSIWIEEYLVNRSKYREEGIELIDPFFGQPVFPRTSHFREQNKDRVFVRSHFVSKAVKDNELRDDIILDREYIQEKTDGTLILRESSEHREGKRILAKTAIEDFSGVTKANVHFEKRVWVPHKNSYRVADVFVDLPSGDLLAMECQLSPISIEELEERNGDYQSQGIDCIWALGSKARSWQNVDFIRDNFGYNPPSLKFGYEKFEP